MTVSASFTRPCGRQLFAQRLNSPVHIRSLPQDRFASVRATSRPMTEPPSKPVGQPEHGDFLLRSSGRSPPSLRTRVIALVAISSVSCVVSALKRSGLSRRSASFTLFEVIQARASTRVAGGPIHRVVPLECGRSLLASTRPRIMASTSAGFSRMSVPASTARTPASSCVK